MDGFGRGLLVAAWIAGCGGTEPVIEPTEVPEPAAPEPVPVPVPIVAAPAKPPKDEVTVGGGRTGQGALGSGTIGIGGGGTAEGLGGLGTKGFGSGASGYGSGGGNFGAKGESGIATVGGDPTFGGPVPTVAPLSQDWKPTGHNPVELASKDFLSTFSIDVDTGSYTQVRRILRAGSVPPPDAVRTEEFVNYQQYAYREPEDGLPFAISVEGAPHPWIPGHHLVQVGIQGQHLSADEIRPVHLTFLVDTSGSMAGEDRLPLVRRALNFLIDRLEPVDTVAIATYAGGTRIVLEPTPAANRELLHGAVDSLQSGGGTAMASGMELAYSMAERTFVDGEENRVLLLSDGDANIGNTSQEKVSAALAGYAKRGITLSTFGFGSGNYRDAMMEQLADDGDGNYTYVDGWQEAERVFGEDLFATTRTIARDVKIQVRFDPESVIAYELVGYENRAIADEDFRNDAVDAGEVGAGHTVTALYDVVLRDRRYFPLATVQVRHKPPGPDAPATEQRVTLPTAALAPTFDEASPGLRLAWGAAAFAEKLRGARELEEVDWSAIIAVVSDALRADTDRDDELLDLVRTAARLSTGPAVAGSIDRHDVDEVIKRHMNQIRYCYERERVKNPVLGGKVVIAFVIAANGLVATASADESTMNDPAVESCVVGRFLRMQFPVPSGGAVRVTYPFLFAPS